MIPARAWLMLVLGVASQTAATVVISTPAFLIPLLHTERGMPLAEAGLFSAAPTVGVVLTLVAWGFAVDRYGERWVLGGGLGLAALATAGALLARGYGLIGVLCGLAGAAAAGTNAASGRVVVGWFPKARRGTAMGIRQMAQPIGVTIAAVTVPSLADAGGIPLALALPLVLAALVAVACGLLIRNPPRPDAAAARAGRNPYQASSFLVRIHLVSVLLVVPQFTLSTFGLVWLVAAVHFSTLTAGFVVGAAQFVGAVGRIAAGTLSDRVGSRVRPLRWVAVAACALMLALAVVSGAGWPLAGALVLVLATTISVADNGLAFTSVAEAAGTAWAGRALGIQNTGQFLASSVVGPAIGLLITAAGYPVAFAVVAACPAVAVPLVPGDALEMDRL
jgi:MFS family permease